ncbi:hypothetical protein BH20ACI4_BH20ACI4_14760 [soil metagenome]
MNYLKIPFLFILSFTFWSCAVAQETPKKEENPATKKANEKIEACEPTPLTDAKTGELKTIAEGANSKIETPFVFIARDGKTYELLKNSVDGLPSASTIDFTKTAVVAAFAGMKNTGGYSLAIKQTGENFAVEILSPPKDAMVTQALTSPYQITLVPVEEEKSLNLTVSEDFKSGAETYKIASSDFTYSGGFAFREKKFSAEGTIELMQSGDLVTLDFNLSGKNTEREMKLTETASGILKDGKIELMRLDAGSFSEGPKPPDKVSGTMNENKLNLTFEPLPTNVADGFSMNGKLEAVKTN